MHRHGSSDREFAETQSISCLTLSRFAPEQQYVRRVGPPTPLRFRHATGSRINRRQT
jgi:hypothetical protein